MTYPYSSSKRTVQSDRPVGPGQHIHHQRTREADTAIIAKNATGFGQIGDTAGRCIRQPDLFQRIQHRVVDTLNVGLRQGLIGATGHASTDWSQMFGQRSGPRGMARRAPAAAGAGGSGRCCGHDGVLS